MWRGQHRKGVWRRYNLATIRVWAVTDLKQTRVVQGHHAQSLLILPDCSPTKTSSPNLSENVWLFDGNLNYLHLRESSSVRQLGLLHNEFSWSCQDPGWHMELQHTTQTTVKTSTRNVCWTHWHCLCLGCSKSNKHILKYQVLWWSAYYSHFLG